MALELVSRSGVVSLFDKMSQAGVTYGLGDKAPSLDCDSSEIKRIDCSGLVRYLIAKNTDNKVHLPDGSWMQKIWCIKNDLQHVHYHNTKTASTDTVFLCFISTSSSEKHDHGPVGHAFIVIGGKTYESHYPNGCHSRPCETPVLWQECDSCFIYPSKA